jgi:hypothetical protein
VWDTSSRHKDDPFFAVQSIVIDAPQVAIKSEDNTTVSITFEFEILRSVSSVAPKTRAASGAGRALN